ncbi:MAG: cytochrome b5 domain-containing protein [Eubacteriales bacterium]|nr:cytochrome b5 domain-containing protein [Eubacteriales bacterium]
MKRLIVIGISVLTLALFAVGCASGAVNNPAAATAAVTDSAAAVATSAPSDIVTTDTAANETLELTLDQLKQYDGKNGNPAYVAVDGIIYDMSNVKAWGNGDHNGYSAGNDLTDIIKNKSPHGLKNLEGLPIVGKLVDG